MNSLITTNKRGLSKRQLAEAVDVRASTIQFYSEIGLLPYAQSGAGLIRRYDRDQAAERLKVIADLQALGLSIPAIKDRLHGPTTAPATQR